MPTLLRPTTLAEASGLARAHGDEGKLVGGGTAVVLMLQQRLIAPDVLIALREVRDIDGYREIRREGDDIRIGGGVTITEVAASPLVAETLPALAYSCSVVGNVRIRNAATLAGNVGEADYASDPPAVLVNSAAMVEIRGLADGRDARVSDLITGYYETTLDAGEVITAIRVPVPAAGVRGTYLKYRSRSSEDRPCVGVAASVETASGLVQSVSITLGAITGVPFHDPALVTTARGHPLDGRLIEEIAEAHSAAVTPIEDARGSAWYRREMVRVFVTRALQALGPSLSEERRV